MRIQRPLFSGVRFGSGITTMNLRILLLAAALGATEISGAQTAPAAAAPASAPTENVTTLSRFVVTGVPVDESINPLIRETDGVLGDSRNPLETPRAASTITSALLAERGLDGVTQLVPFSPGAYAPSDYGRVTTPQIRGDTAETYLNGQRLSYNLYGYLPSFNGIEAADLVRGPGSAVYGAGFFQGGYVNYVTKRPQFAAASTTVTARLGSWVPGGGSFLNGSVQIDQNTPVSDKLAWRVSYEGKAGDTFYRANDLHDDREDFFGALTWKPNSRLTLDFNAQFLWQNSPEALGVNRVNQQLIWHDTYYTGASADLAAGPGAIPATTVVTLPRNATQFSRGDFSNADVARSQLIATLVLAPDLTLVNRTLAEYVTRRSDYQFEYAEYATQGTFENRTELHGKLGAEQSFVAGATLRWESRVSYVNYFNEYAYNFDLTNPSRVFNQAAQFPNSYYPGRVGPGGRLFFGAIDGSPDTTDSRVWNPAVFWQHDAKLAENLSLLVGVRGDGFYARAQDPLPDPTQKRWRDTEHAYDFSHNESLLYRLSPRASLYATYQQVRGTNGSTAGGGLLLNGPDGKIDPGDLRNRSDLAELGAKFSLLDHRLYTAVATFEQRRTKIQLGGDHDDIRLRGLELEAVYQPTPRLSATANATLQDGRYVNSSPFQFGGRDIYAAYLRGRGPGGLGTSTGAVDPYGNQVPVGDWTLPGFSHTLLNGSVRYRWENGFGGALNAEWQSRQPGNLDDQWHIPSQYTLNASLFYVAKKWEANVDFLNLTNQRNWVHNGDAYTASQLISEALPLRLEGYVKWKF